MKTSKSISAVSALTTDNELLSKITECYYQCAENQKLDNVIVSRITGETQYVLSKAAATKGQCFCCGVSFEEHHIGGKNNSSITVTVCTRCHQELNNKQMTWDSRWSCAGNSTNLKNSFVIQGLQDVLALKSDNTGIKEYKVMAGSLSKLIRNYRENN